MLNIKSNSLQNSRLFPAALFVTALAFAFLIPPHKASADALPAIIIAPESSPTPPFDINGSAESIFPSISTTLTANLDQLHTNLGILIDLNTAQNQAILDRLGRDNGATSTLGTDFKAAIAGIDTAKLKRDGDTFSGNSAGILKNYQKTLIALANRIKNGDVQNGTLPETVARPAVHNLNAQMAALGKLDVAVNILNINLISINKTYINLLSLSKQSPAILTTMPDLALKLNSLDKMATKELVSLPEIDAALAKANSGYELFRKDGGLDSLTDPGSNSRETLGSINAGLRKTTDSLHMAMMDMADTLGRLPVRAAAANTSPAPATNKIDLPSSVFHSTQ